MAQLTSHQCRQHWWVCSSSVQPPVAASEWVDPHQDMGLSLHWISPTLWHHRTTVAKNVGWLVNSDQQVAVACSVIAHHITLLWEVAISQALWSHPFNWQLHHLTRAALSEVVFCIHIFWQTKVSDLYQKVSVNPRGKRDLGLCMQKESISLTSACFRIAFLSVSVTSLVVMFITTSEVEWRNSWSLG